jgi:HTH-type transcriptional regulator / antitoxin HipB
MEPVSAPDLLSIFPNGKMDAHVKTPEELGALIRARRNELKLTQEDLAGVALVTPRLLGEVERGKPTAQLDGLLRILAALGIDLFARPR